MRTDPKAREEEISRAVAKMQAGVLALVCGLIGGLGLFIATVWLLLKGGPQVGSHLQLLSNYFVGYSVTWPGSFVGLFYGALTGGLLGWAIGMIYNKIVGIRLKGGGRGSVIIVLSDQIPSCFDNQSD